MNKKPAFTILEILLTTSALIILFAIVIIAINPARSFLDSRNSQRNSNVGQIANAIYQYYVYNGTFPSGINSDWQVIGTGDNVCQVDCGSVSSVPTEFQNLANNAASFNGTHSQTLFNTGTNYLEMTNIGMQTGVAAYTSPILIAQNITDWQTLTVIPRAPYGKELPNNKALETGYERGAINMSNNVLLLHMNETSGNVVYDSSGNGLNGTAYDASKYQINQTGILNKAIRFTNNSSNENGQVRVPHNSLLSFTTQGTVCTWVNLTDTSQRYAGFVKKGQLANFSDEEYSLQMFTSSSQPIFNVSDTTGADNYVTSSQALTAGTWHHLCGTINTASGLKIYVNGVQRGNLNWPSGRIIRNATGSLQIGAQNITNSELGMKGMLDEVAIFNRELSAIEIQALHDRAKLKFSLQLRACNEADCSDASFVGPDGTAATSYTDDSLTVTPYPLSGLSDSKYFQYKLNLNTTATTLTPQIASVNLTGFSTIVTTGGQCLNLKPYLVENLIANIPYDPQFGSDENTYYAVRSTGLNRIAIRACAAEAGLKIEATK